MEKPEPFIHHRSEYSLDMGLLVVGSVAIPVWILLNLWWIGIVVSLVLWGVLAAVGVAGLAFGWLPLSIFLVGIALLAVVGLGTLWSAMVESYQEYNGGNR